MFTPMTLVITTCLAILALILLMRHKYKLEKAKWNQGYCAQCGNDWDLFYKEEDGARLYKCSKGHIIRIFYQRIDL